MKMHVVVYLFTLLQHHRNHPKWNIVIINTRISFFYATQSSSSSSSSLQIISWINALFNKMLLCNCSNKAKYLLLHCRRCCCCCWCCRCCCVKYLYALKQNKNIYHFASSKLFSLIKCVCCCCWVFFIHTRSNSHMYVCNTYAILVIACNNLVAEASVVSTYLNFNSSYCYTFRFNDIVNNEIKC